MWFITQNKPRSLQNLLKDWHMLRVRLPNEYVRASSLPAKNTKNSHICSSRCNAYTHLPVSVQERTLHVLKWRSERSLDPQLSAGFRSLYSLFAWFTLGALIAPCWIFLVFWKVGRTLRERLWEHMRRGGCRQTMVQMDLLSHLFLCKSLFKPDNHCGQRCHLQWGWEYAKNNKGTR